MCSSCIYTLYAIRPFCTFVAGVHIHSFTAFSCSESICNKMRNADCLFIYSIIFGSYPFYSAEVALTLRCSCAYCECLFVSAIFAYRSHVSSGRDGYAARIFAVSWASSSGVYASVIFVLGWIIDTSIRHRLFALDASSALSAVLFASFVA